MESLTARFIGEHGSLGYQHGAVYDLRVHSTASYPIAIRRAWGGGFCPYASLEAFERNWLVVEPGETDERAE